MDGWYTQLPSCGVSSARCLRRKLVKLQRDRIVEMLKAWFMRRRRVRERGRKGKGGGEGEKKEEKGRKEREKERKEGGGGKGRKREDIQYFQKFRKRGGISI